MMGLEADEYGLSLREMMAIREAKPPSDHDRGYFPPFVVPDPCTVFRDALLYTSWTEEGGSLPQRGDWSTYRLASKDIILGVVTHRFNATTRCLDVRSYVCGEHPIFEELEPTRALMAMLLCQAYQTGNSLQICFEQGVPFDVRALIERHTGEWVSGHSTLLTDEVTRPLFISICGLSPQMQARIAEHKVGVGTVCYHIFRGTWSSYQVNALLERGVPLGWLFHRSPHPIGSPAPYAHLVHHLRAVLLEEYALKRLEDRQFGETTSKRLFVIEGESPSNHVSEQPLQIAGADGVVQIAANQRFVMLPVLPLTPDASASTIRQGLTRSLTLPSNQKALLVIPMDFLYASDKNVNDCTDQLRASKVNWLVVGQTMAQLLSEIEQKLAITAAQVDENEVDAANVDRHTD